LNFERCIKPRLVTHHAAFFDMRENSVRYLFVIYLDNYGLMMLVKIDRYQAPPPTVNSHATRTRDLPCRNDGFH